MRNSASEGNTSMDNLMECNAKMDNNMTSNTTEGTTTNTTKCVEHRTCERVRGSFESIEILR